MMNRDSSTAGRAQTAPVACGWLLLCMGLTVCGTVRSTAGNVFAACPQRETFCVKTSCRRVCTKFRECAQTVQYIPH